MPAPSAPLCPRCDHPCELQVTARVARRRGPRPGVASEDIGRRPVAPREASPWSTRSRRRAGSRPSGRSTGPTPYRVETTWSGQSGAEAPEGAPVTRTYVLDTSVLLSDPRAMVRFAEHEVVLPVVVITELEAKRHHPELGFFARSALRMLDDMRVQHGRLDHPVPVGDAGGSLRVELNHVDTAALPAGFRLGDNDTRILAVAKNLADEGNDVTLVSKDLPLRIKASACGLAAEEYRAELAVDSGWTGMTEIHLNEAQMAALWQNERVDLAEVDLTGQDVGPLLCHTGVVLHSSRGSALARVTTDKHLRLVRGDQDVFGVHGRSAEQQVDRDPLLGAAAVHPDDVLVPAHQAQVLVGGHPGQRGAPRGVQHHAGVAEQRADVLAGQVHLGEVHPLVLPERRHLRLVEVDLGHPGPARVDGELGAVLLGRQTARRRLDPQREVLGDERHVVALVGKVLGDEGNDV